MAEQNKELSADSIPKKSGFQKGHPRFGGRKVGQPMKRTRKAIDTARRKGFDAVEWMINIVQTGGVPDPEDKTMLVIIPVEERLKMLREVAPYLHAKLHTVAMTGEGGGPIQHALLDINALIKDPALARAAETLSLAITKNAALEGSVQAIAHEIVDEDNEDSDDDWHNIDTKIEVLE